jgi:hypothetical protein
MAKHIGLDLLRVVNVEDNERLALTPALSQRERE